MGKLINLPENIIEETIKGIVVSTPNVKKLENFNVIVRREMSDGKVGIVSGGGSGHEPAHAGFVGKGMIDAAVLGPIFSSPTPDQILSAIKAANTGNGVLLIIKNYTGDIINSEMAIEFAEMEGIKCGKVIVNDDVAVEDSTHTAGRRGIAGTILVQKILGGMAEDGKTLEELVEYGQNLVKRVKSLGMSASSCFNPQSGKKMFEMPDDEMEIGMGIHGEPGIAREKIKPVKEIVAEMLDRILKECDNNGKYKVLINGLSSTPLMELFIIANDVAENLKNQNYDIIDIKVGNFITSLNMDGFSITLLRMENDDQMYLEKNTEASRW